MPVKKQNLIEKIAQKFAVGLEEGHMVHSGDYLLISPAHVMSHDNTGAIIPKFNSIGAKELARPRQVVITLDHNIQDKGEANLDKYKKIEEFALKMGADFYPAGRGIGHQIMCEEGYILPGTMAVASDSHSNMYGGLGCLGTPVVRTDAAAIWATGRTWWRVPPVAKVVLKGKLRPGVVGKDIIVTLCGHFNKDEVLNHALEFQGDGVASLSTNERLTIANMTTEWGALAAVFPTDEVTIDWFEKRCEYINKRGLANVSRLNAAMLQKLKSDILRADEDAFYAKELTLDLSTVTPHVSGPSDVKVMTPVSEMRNVRVQKAYLLSCVNSRVEDIAGAAKVVEGKKIASGVELYLAAASDEVQAEATKAGHWQALLDAGAIELPPGCGPCIGLGRGLLEDGEVGISATNRNFIGRMGSKFAKAYLASPAVVAASAIAGHIATPFFFELEEVKATVISNIKADGKSQSIPIIDGFLQRLAGDLVFCPQDNINTDGIYAGKYTYNDNITPEQQAEVVMENYDPEFTKLAREGDILVGGNNFGTGSSREQAVTALKHKGIRLVIAGSFSETYKRNALNNGFLAIECPELVSYLKTKYGTDKPTITTKTRAELDFKGSELRFDGNVYKFSPIGIAAQELIVSDGLEKWVRNRLQ